MKARIGSFFFGVIALAGATWVLGSALLYTPPLKYTSSKICQVTGIVDLQHPKELTGFRRSGVTGGVTGTDLGFPFEYRGRLVMLFGDSREFDPDRCEPAWCGTDDAPKSAVDPDGRLKRWRTIAEWNAWTANRGPGTPSAEGGDSIVTSAVDFDPESCITARVETDEVGSVYAHVVGQTAMRPAIRLEGEPVASRPQDKWVTLVEGRILVITKEGTVFAHALNGNQVDTPFQLSGPPVGARPEDRWIAPMGNRLLVGTADGRVFAHQVSTSAIAPAVQLAGATVAARPEDRWVLVAADRLVVVTSDGRVFAHRISGDVIAPAIQLGGPAVAARPEDKWLLVVGDRLLVVTQDGRAFAHDLSDTAVGVRFELGGPYVGSSPQDQRVIAHGERLFVLTGPDGRFRPTWLDGKLVGRQEGAIGAVVEGDTIHTFFTMKTPGVNESGQAIEVAHDDIPFGGKSVLARSDDGGRSFRQTAQVSTGRFLWTVPAVQHARNVSGLPDGMSGDVALVWGAGRINMRGEQTQFHHSYPYLAVAPLTAIADMSRWRYFAGVDSKGRPQWADSEVAAKPVRPFGLSTYGEGFHECLGYFTVRRIETWNKWVMLYACDFNAEKRYNPQNGPRGIYLRTADAPWGPWSQPAFALNPDVAYCQFMYFATSGRCKAGDPNPAELSVRIPFTDPSERAFGGEYAPILLPSRYMKGSAQDGMLYYLMGTWNPYQVVLMRLMVRPPSLLERLAGMEQIQTFLRQ
jgi:hypothetical protein